MNILTFDIEDWFHINDSTWTPHEKWHTLESRVVKNTHTLLETLREHNITATFFVMGWIAEHFPQLLHQINADGHEIGYHSYYHQLPVNQSEDEFNEDLRKGLSLIESITGKKVKIYRAPNLSLNEQTTWMVPILIKNGIEISSSTKSFRKINGQVVPNEPFIWKTESGELPEFPLNRWNIPGFPLVFTGSGYFRLYPFWFIHYLYSRHPYNNGYFHPNDIDAKVPMPKELGRMRNWMNTVGSATALQKMDHLFRVHKFISIEKAWESLATDKKQSLLKRIDVKFPSV